MPQIRLQLDDFVPPERVVPFPRAQDREAWQTLQQTPLGGRRSAYLMGLAEEMQLQDWPQLPASLWAEYERTGIRKSYEAPYYRRRQKLGVLVLAECLQGEGRFLDEIVKGMTLIAEEATWNVPSQVDRHWDIGKDCDPNRVLALFSCETAAVLAEAVYLLEAALTQCAPALVERIRREILERIVVPAEEEIDTYWWSDGRNNWAPWCVSNILGAALYTLKDRERLAALVVNGLVPVINHYMERYPADGACDEGSVYWNAGPGSLLIFLEHLRVLTDGAVDIYDAPAIKAMGEFAANAHLTGPWALNFADARPTYSLRPAIAYRFAERIGSAPLKAVTQHFMRGWAPDGPVTPPLTRKVCGGDLIYMLRELFWMPGKERVGELTKPKTVWYPHTQILVARENTVADRGFILAAKGGHNGENHNHNDVGHFVLYRDGQPFIVDMGVGSYTAKTFSERRYEIHTMRSISHNMPVIDGIEQAPGAEFGARDVVFTGSEAGRSLSMDLSHAYPRDIHVSELRRTLTHRGNHVRVEDRYAIASSRRIVLNLYTPAAVEPCEAGAILRMEGREMRMEVSGALSLKMDVQAEELEDASLKNNWGRESLTRITLSGTVTAEAPAHTLLFR